MHDASGVQDDSHCLAYIQAGTDEQVEAGWEALYRRYGDRLIHYLLAKGFTFQEAEDLAGSAWERAVRRIGDFEDRGVGFFPWLRAIVDHARLEHYKQRYLTDISLDASGAMPAGDDDPADSALRALTREQLQRAIAEALADAPADYRTALEARVLCDLSPADIMALEGWSRSKVDTTLHRARGWLKAELLARHGASTPLDWLDGT